MKVSSKKDDMNGKSFQNEPFPEKEGEMDEELCKLRNLYMELKKERHKTEKDTNLLENKLKLLQTEEEKAYKKMNIEKKSKGDWENARKKTLEFKAYLTDIKNQRKKEEQNMNLKIKEMRENISNKQKERKDYKFQESRFNNLQMKQAKLVRSDLK